MVFLCLNSKLKSKKSASEIDFNKLIFIQNNDLKHALRLILNWMNEKELDVLYCLSQSLNMNLFKTLEVSFYIKIG
ncbi:hypothetical protein HERIO_2330 [Hepatospora eriocheir]|uniref:Uncharacterized protein n=1 Tax=Hepatospora eriocheir TaxID=1081669 RepID=A0A1X0Q7B3_9MICR|nr:hypothetical protein HERIO_2330 [Hepatospora eriocheir]